MRIQSTRVWINEQFVPAQLVLENDKLIATFLPEQGGRLWSLKNKATGKEVLYKNPVFQPANLGIRNA